ncbi:MAG: carnitine 3-dehydrogenase [Arenicella sp.]|jgi:carnitine 3-dehydrogenase
MSAEIREPASEKDSEKDSRQIKAAAVIGGGVIGGGWVARFLLMGIDVNVYDTDPQAQRKISEVLTNARRSLPDLYEHRLPVEGRLVFSESVEAAVMNVDWVSECVPEQLALKQRVLSEVQSYCSRDTIISSSTSGFKPSQLQFGSARPSQIIVAHPFNPVYLVPLVELVGDLQTTENAKKMLTKIGCFPLIVRKEIDAHIADRLLEAVWREGLWLVNDGIATTQEIDDAISYGFGLRWAQMGLFETYRIAGGEAGMAHFIKQFGPALEWPWTKLMDVPELSDSLVQTIADQSDAHSGHHSIRQLERIRDDNLVAMMRSLKGTNWGAGELLNKMDKQLSAEAHKAGDYLSTINRIIPSSWVDYNGHMNDSRYGEVFSVASDQVMKIIGANQDYIDGGMSYFTVDMHISYIKECHHGDAITVETRIANGQGKKLELEHAMLNARGELVASCDQLLIHVDLNARKSCLPRDSVALELSKLADLHQSTSKPY